MPSSRALRVAAASLAASATDFGVLAVSRRAGVAVWLAALLGCLAGGATNFAALRRRVFRSTTGVARSALRYGLLVVLGGAVLTSALAALGVALGLPLLVVRLAAGAIVLAVWGYPVSSRVVFKEENPHASP